MLVAVLSASAANAQFEKGRKTISAGVSGFDIGFSGVNGLDIFNLDLGARGSYFFANNFAAVVGLGANFVSYDGDSATNFNFEVGARYYFWDAMYGGLSYNGCKYEGVDDLESVCQLEVGYTYHISNSVYFEPALYYQMGFGDLRKDYSKLGLSIGIGIRF